MTRQGNRDGKAVDLSSELLRVESLKGDGALREAEAELAKAWGALGVDRRSLHMQGPLALGHAVPRAGLRTVLELLAHEAEILQLAGDRDSGRTVARWTLSAMLHSAPPGDYADLTGRLVASADGRLRTPALGMTPVRVDKLQPG